MIEIIPDRVKYFHQRADWRHWLEENYLTEQEVWLAYPKKATGKPRIIYNDAVEEALCFGWIDSIIKTLDEDHSVQRFTPRRKGSGYSQQNRERLRWLLEHELIHPDVVAEATQEVNRKFVYPKDILQLLKKDAKAWEFYNQQTDAYKRIRINWIDSARVRPEEFQKRLNNFLEFTRAGKQVPGHGGIDKYY